MLKRIHLLLAGFLLGIACLGLPSRAFGTQIRAKSWERLADEADFVGVVVCTTAGGIVARYRVEESWKGVPADAEVLLRRPPDRQGDRFPVSLCGQRYLVTAFNKARSLQTYSESEPGYCPLWWRRIDADLELPDFQGLVELRAGNLRGWEPSGAKSLGELKQRIVDFLSLPDPERERRNLIDEAVETRSLFISGDKESSDKFRQKLQGLPTLEEVIVELFASASDFADKMSRVRLLNAMPQAGGTQTLAVLQKLSKQEKGIDSESLAWVERELAAKLGKSGSMPPLRQPEPVPEEIKTAAETLKSTPWDHESARALAILAKHNPEEAVLALRDWSAATSDERLKSWGYHLGSSFAYLCLKDRERHLVALLDAKDDFVRVAAAVYLRHINPGLAVPKLRELSTLPGDPGAWAAVVLASSGDKAAFRRALEVFSTSLPQHGLGSVHRLLQQRMLILLSNSARHSGINPPNLDDADTDMYHHDPKTVFYEPCVEWWERNKEKIKLHDPWLKALDEQGVD